MVCRATLPLGGLDAQQILRSPAREICSWGRLKEQSPAVMETPLL